MVEFFMSYNLLVVTDERLCKIVSRMVVFEADRTNCDEAESVGTCIMTGVDTLPFQDITIKYAQQIKPSSVSCLKLAIGVMKVGIHLNVHFSRLLIVMLKKSGMEPLFSFELIPEPARLFCDCFVHKMGKAALAMELLRSLPRLQ
jgi:hypothetical protein